MRTLFEKGFTARFETRDKNNICQHGGFFMISSSLKKVFSLIFFKDIHVFILDNIADNIFPQISRDIEKVCERGIVFHKKIKNIKKN